MSSFVAEVPLPLNTLSSWSRGALHEYLQQDGLAFDSARMIWHALLTSLRTPTLSEKQTTSTCNCVRIFLKSISTTRSRDIRNLPLDRDAWLSCYHAVRDAWPRAKVKPLAQVLEVLLQTAKRDMPADELNSVWRMVSLELSAVILRGQPSRHLRGAFALSTFFLEKDLSYEIYHDSAGQNMRQGEGDEENTSDALKCLLNSVLLGFEQHDAQSSAEKCFKALLKAQHVSNLDSWWFLVREFVADHIDSLDKIAISIFPVLLEQAPSLQLDAIQSKCDCKDQAGLLFSLALLQSLRDRETISQNELIGLLQRTVVGPISGSPDAIEFLLSHADDGIRVRVLRLLLTSKMTNAPLSLPILRHVQGNIALWFRPGGSHERGELLSIIRRLLKRLRGGSSALEKSASLSTLDVELLNVHKEFVAALVTNVLAELGCNASYQRHVVGLSILRYLFESKIDSCDRRLVLGDERRTSNDPDWPLSLCLRQTKMVQDLLNLTSDAFEDVRALSAAILKHLLSSGPSFQSRLFSKQLQEAMETLIPELEAEAAQTNRSDQADGLGRLYSLYALTQQRSSGSGKHLENPPVIVGLLERLEQLLADKRIFDQPDPQPLHSLLLGVMYSVEEGNNGTEFQDRIISISRQVWIAVADRLCVDSPETETSDEEAVFEEVGTGPQDMLSYSWRALRDSSLVLRSLLKACGLQSSHLLRGVGDIGNLCMEQLTKLRHRGAFSTVAQTFTVCCQRAIDIQGQELVGLRCNWYGDAEAQVNRQADRLTRRSAGLPAMLASILSPDDDISFRHFVDSFIAKSQVTALDPTDRLSLPQVHAMNTLREVMINSRFRNAILPHIEKLLTLATNNLGSEIWAIQNCGLMLYRACILRLPHEDDGQLLRSEATIAEGSSSPVKLAIDLLCTGMSQPPSPTQVVSSLLLGNYDSPVVGVEQKFAALDMIAHVHPAKDLKHDVRALVIELLSSPVWLIRERAAEVLAFLTPLGELRDNFNEFLNGSKLDATQNKLHGTLLFCRQLLRRRFAHITKLELPSALDEIMQKVLVMMAQIGQRRLAPPVWAALFEVANTVSEHLLKTEVRSASPFLDHEDLLKKVEIHGYYLPESALMYNVSLELIKSDRLGLQKNVVFHTILGRMVSEPNVAKSILERLLSRGLVFKPHDLSQLCKFVSAETHPDAIPLLIDMISLSVERNLSDWDNWEARGISEFLDECSAWSPSREIGASSLVAQARLVLIHQLKPRGIPDHDLTLSGLQYGLERDVSYAARNEMDTFVRLQAAKALSAYLLGFPQTGATGFGLLLTLRSLLNDDDEDVRSHAAHTASIFLGRGNGNLQLGILADGTCAPAVSTQLEDYLRSIVYKYKLEPEFLLCRLVDVSLETSLVSYLVETPVKLQLKMIKNGSRALFAVERQNLYIDEVREVRFWASLWAIMAKRRPQLPEKVKIAIAIWVVDGLDAVLTMLRGIEDVSSMLPNVTHDLDTQILCLRVISVAGACVTLLANEAHDQDSIRQMIMQQLQNLKLLSSRHHFHPELTRTIDGNLEEIHEITTFLRQPQLTGAESSLSQGESITLAFTPLPRTYQDCAVDIS